MFFNFDYGVLFFHEIFEYIPDFEKAVAREQRRKMRRIPLNVCVSTAMDTFTMVMPKSAIFMRNFQCSQRLFTLQTTAMTTNATKVTDVEVQLKSGRIC
jgi:hypothetical protein